MSNTMKIDTNRKEEIKEARTIKNRDRVIEFRDDKEKNRKRKSWMVLQTYCVSEKKMLE